MNAIRILLIAFLACGLAEAAERADPRDDSYLGVPIIKDSRPAFVLFSWRGKGGIFRYALIRDTRETFHRFLDGFEQNRRGLVRLQDLEKTLAKLPKRSVVTWMKDEPNAVTYPKQSVVRKVKQFAARMQIDLQFNETRYEQPGVQNRRHRPRLRSRLSAKAESSAALLPGSVTHLIGD